MWRENGDGSWTIGFEELSTPFCPVCGKVSAKYEEVTGDAETEGGKSRVVRWEAMCECGTKLIVENTEEEVGDGELDI